MKWYTLKKGKVLESSLSFIHPLSSVDVFSHTFLQAFIKRFKQNELKIYIFIVNSYEMDVVSKKLTSVTTDKRYVILSKDELLKKLPKNLNILDENKHMVLAISKHIYTKHFVLVNCKNSLTKTLTYQDIKDNKNPHYFLMLETKVIQTYVNSKNDHHIDRIFDRSFKKVSSYKGFYINLKKDAERKREITKNLKTLDFKNYECFDALDGSILASQYTTQLDNGSLGCGFSHKRVLEENIGSDVHLHIIEDDVILHKYLPNTFDNIKDKIEWDIIYTDIYFSLLSPGDFYLLNEKYKRYKEKSEISVVNLKGIAFSGANSYFVNKHSIKKLHDALSGDWYKHSKHDTYINSLVQKGKLNAYVIIPFVSTFSKHSQHSTIDEEYSSNMLALDTLRGAFYIDAPLKKLVKEIEDINTSPMIDIYTKVTKILLNNLEKRIDIETVFLD